MVKIKQIKLKSLKRISKLLEKRGIDLTTAKVGEYIVLEKNGSLMKFVIEKFDENKVSIGFYGIQNGDSMKDPELTFIISEQMKFNEKKGIIEKVVYLIPESFENNYVGIYDEVYLVRDKQVHFKPSGQKGIIDLVKNMDLNLSMREDQF